MEKVDGRKCQLKSGTMDAEGFRRSVRSLQEQGVVLKEIVIDTHLQISSIMSMLFIGRYILYKEFFKHAIFVLYFEEKNFPEIKHIYDMWHGAKNLGKKNLMSVSFSVS